jgi:hypothetical protein
MLYAQNTENPRLVCQKNLTTYVAGQVQRGRLIVDLRQWELNPAATAVFWLFCPCHPPRRAPPKQDAPCKRNRKKSRHSGAVHFPRTAAKKPLLFNFLEAEPTLPTCNAPASGVEAGYVGTAASGIRNILGRRIVLRN